MSKQRFFVLESPHVKLRIIFEVYERIDRVLILSTDTNGTHGYTTHTILGARGIWKSYTTDRPQNLAFSRNNELENELNAPR